MEIKQNRKLYLDGLSCKIARERTFDLPMLRYVRKYKNHSLLFSLRGKTNSFFTLDSKLYYTPEEYRQLKLGEKIVRISGRLDSLHSRHFEKSRIYASPKQSYTGWKLEKEMRERYSYFCNCLIDRLSNRFNGMSLAKAWNVSLAGAIIFGMLTMTIIYKYLGESVSAKGESHNVVSQVNLMSEDFFTDEEYQASFLKIISQEYEKNKDKEQLEKEIREMVKGYPIEEMAPEIAKKDRMIAALLVAIARKESSWGKRVPVLNGQDCFNYWGYRGIRKRMGTGGHTCFDSRKDAVDTVAKRIETLVNKEKLNTPAKMVVWKCGYDCSWDSKAAVNKWISDVDYYFQKLNKEEGEKPTSKKKK